MSKGNADDDDDECCGGSIIKKCRKKVTNDDDALECVECRKWFHSECQNISKPKYQKICDLKVLTKESETSDGIEWRCDRCRTIKTELGQIKQRVNNIEANLKKDLNDLKLETAKKFDDLKKELLEQRADIKVEIINEMQMRDKKLVENSKRKLDAEIKQIEVRVNHKVENEVKERMIENQEEINKIIEKREIVAGTGTPSSEVTKIVDQKITERLNEEEEKRQRENKVIFFGLKEEGNLEAKQRAAEDRVKLIELFEIMKTKEEILSITRLGKKKEGSCRPVLVEVQNEKVKWNIIGRAKLLRESKKGEGIYISPDLTVQERKDALELRNELKKKREESQKNEDGRGWIIKKGRVVEKK
jgi:hypothetical protein